MKATCYLVFTKSGVSRMTKTHPTLDGGEYAVRVRVEAPDSLFSVPIATADIVIEAPDAIAPTVTIEPPRATNLGVLTFRDCATDELLDDTLIPTPVKWDLDATITAPGIPAP